jgi:hypothetical protein
VVRQPRFAVCSFQDPFSRKGIQMENYDFVPLLTRLIAEGTEALAKGEDIDGLRETFRCALAHIEYNAKYGPPGPDQPRVTASGFGTAQTDLKKLLQSEGFDTSGGLIFELVKAVEGIARAHTRMFDQAIKRGEYVKLTDVQHSNLKIAIGFKRTLENAPARYADQMAAELGVSAHTLEQKLRTMLKEVLDMMGERKFLAPPGELEAALAKVLKGDV